MGDPSGRGLLRGVEVTEWLGFFQSSASAAATLIGLVVIAISINVARILAYPHLPARAAAAIAPLAGVLVVTLLGLVPGQPLFLFGLEALAAGAAMGLLGILILAGGSPRDVVVPPLRRWSNLLLNQAQSLPFVVAGVLMMLRNPAGAYWLAPGVVFSLLAGLVNTWVLLVEILR